MTQAEYWHNICAQKMDDGADILSDAWSRQILADAAKKTDCIGFYGFLWTFEDGSKIIAHPTYTLVNGRRISADHYCPQIRNLSPAPISAITRILSWTSNAKHYLIHAR